MTVARKGPGATRTVAPSSQGPILGAETSPNGSEPLGSPRRGLGGLFGLLIRACVYMTAVVIVELILSAFNDWLVRDE